MKNFYKIINWIKRNQNQIERILGILIIFCFFVSLKAEASLKKIEHSKKSKVSNTAEKVKGKQLNYLSVHDGKILDKIGHEIKLRGFHYDCFYVLGKKIYEANLLNNGDPDQLNIEIAKYFFAEDDIIEFKLLNANVVRIGFKLWQIEKRPFFYSEKILKHLDNTIEKWGKNGIYVILDLHAAGQNSFRHNLEYGNVIWKDKELQKRIFALWKFLAQRYAGNPWIAGYDILNEPEAPTKNDLREFYEKCISSIRKYNKHHIIFIEANVGKHKNILFGGEYLDPNLALSIHFYKPHKFTLQGIQGMQGRLKYPEWYGKVYWNKKQIDKELSQIINVAKKRKRPLFIGEFSANIQSRGKSALQWNKDVIDIMNTKGINFTFFCYKLINRDSNAYYVASEDVYRKIIDLRRRVLRDRSKYFQLTKKEKELFLTKNFVSYTELGKILKDAFEGKVFSTIPGTQK
jgi:aryl-phospho-beta-D-glucosidase BglC (GH1 family)